MCRHDYRGGTMSEGKIRELARKISESKGGSEERLELKNYLSTINDSDIIFSARQHLGDIAQIPTIVSLLNNRINQIEFINKLSAKSKELLDRMSTPENRNRIPSLEIEITELISTATPDMIELAIVHFQNKQEYPNETVLTKLQLAQQNRLQPVEPAAIESTPIAEEVQTVTKHKGRLKGLREIFSRANKQELQEKVMDVSTEVATVAINDTEEMDTDQFVSTEASSELKGLDAEAGALKKAFQDFKTKAVDKKNNALASLEKLGKSITNLLKKPSPSEYLVLLAIKLSNQKAGSLMARNIEKQVTKVIASCSFEELKRAEDVLEKARFRATPPTGVKNTDAFREKVQYIRAKVTEKINQKLEKSDAANVMQAARAIDTTTVQPKASKQEEGSTQSAYTFDPAGLESILEDLYHDDPHQLLVSALMIKAKEFEATNKDDKTAVINKTKIVKFRNEVKVLVAQKLKGKIDPEIIKKAIVEIREKRTDKNTEILQAGLNNIVSVLQSTVEMPQKSQKVIAAYQAKMPKARAAVKEAAAQASEQGMKEENVQKNK